MRASNLTTNCNGLCNRANAPVPPTRAQRPLRARARVWEGPTGRSPGEGGHLDRDPGSLETDSVTVRTLAPTDIDWVVRIDSQYFGRQRREYYKLKLAESDKDTGVRISLAALIKGEPAGFLMGRLYYGEFGQPEPIAILDSMGVASAYAGQKVGQALMRQLEMNLSGLGIERVQTQVEWDQVDLIKFFQRSGFLPAPRLCLEKAIKRPLG